MNDERRTKNRSQKIVRSTGQALRRRGARLGTAGAINKMKAGMFGKTKGISEYDRPIQDLENPDDEVRIRQERR